MQHLVYFTIQPLFLVLSYPQPPCHSPYPAKPPTPVLIMPSAPPSHMLVPSDKRSYPMLCLVRLICHPAIQPTPTFKSLSIPHYEFSGFCLHLVPTCYT
jgi:hypothetical protein